MCCVDGLGFVDMCGGEGSGGEEMGGEGWGGGGLVESTLHHCTWD